ncbi:MAG: hypothetical protein ACD_51C00247G0003 [uncultured bacterium]|nr:MAG: hypothetical protein ACD_51C00247G0003 [uncultured bacterium]
MVDIAKNSNKFGDSANLFLISKLGASGKGDIKSATRILWRCANKNLIIASSPLTPLNSLTMRASSAISANSLLLGALRISGGKLPTSGIKTPASKSFPLAISIRVSLDVTAATEAM